MKIDEEILVNRFGQDLIKEDLLIEIFNNLKLEAKRAFLSDLIYLILQSKVSKLDIQTAISNSNLKASFTPCVMLRKGVDSFNLFKISRLPETELTKVFILYLNLFKVGYKRRWMEEKDVANKWWYWDLSNQENILKIKKMYESL